MHVSAIIAAAGSGTRFGAAQPKQLLKLRGRTILEHTVEAFIRSPLVQDIVVALPPDLARQPPDYLSSDRKHIQVVAGGRRRQDSVAAAFEKVKDRATLVVIHDAARPLVKQDLIGRTVFAAQMHGAAIAALPAHDTVKRGGLDTGVSETLPRDEIFLAQTPQVFRVDVLRDALALSRADVDATDEAMLAEMAGHRVDLALGDPDNIKITRPEDLAMAEFLMSRVVPGIRIGNGYDLHVLVEGRPLVLGGVTIPFEKGLQGHSDADAVCHAITDAILGAAGAGDIGRHFPDDDPTWKDANSLELLQKAAGLVNRLGFALGNLDVVIIAQRPKLAPFIDRMVMNLAVALDCEPGRISLKGKTNEGVDSMGTGASIAVHAVALLSHVAPGL